MTREHGVVASAAGLIPFGHLGWGFVDRPEFLARAAQYIVDGLNQNQLVKYVGEGSREEVRAELASIPDIAGGLDAGLVKVSSAGEHYAFRPGSDILDPEVAVAGYAAATAKAIADGYTGYRAVVDVTPVARTREQRDALAKLEYLVDQEMAVRPLSVLCAYNLSQLGATAAELICLHPYVSPGISAFQLYAESGIECALTGELDAASDELFVTTLQRILPLLADETPVIDARGLEFIDHRQLCNLDQYARSAGRHVVLRTDQLIVFRLASLLDLTNVAVKPADAGDGRRPSECLTAGPSRAKGGNDG